MAWCTAWVECRLCGHRHVSVYPEDIIDEDAQECPNCGHMACELSDEGDEKC